MKNNLFLMIATMILSVSQSYASIIYRCNSVSGYSFTLSKNQNGNVYGTVHYADVLQEEKELILGSDIYGRWVPSYSQRFNNEKYVHTNLNFGIYRDDPTKGYLSYSDKNAQRRETLLKCSKLNIE